MPIKHQAITRTDEVFLSIKPEDQFHGIICEMLTLSILRGPNDYVSALIYMMAQH